MGMSASGIIAFGIPLDEDDALFPEIEEGDDPEYASGFSEENFEKWIAEQAGIIAPQEEWVQGSKNTAWSYYWDRQRKAVAEFPIEVVAHCSCDYPLYIIALRGTVMKAWDGEPRDIMLPSIPAEKVQMLIDFCAEHGIKGAAPRWLLTSNWG
jgi:hypothetical protein